MREFIHLVFDNNLYYQNGIYRIPYMMDALVHNHLIMKEKGSFVKKSPPKQATRDSSRTPDTVFVVFACY